MYINIYIYMYVYIYTYIYVYVYIYVHMYRDLRTFFIHNLLNKHIISTLHLDFATISREFRTFEGETRRFDLTLKYFYNF